MKNDHPISEIYSSLVESKKIFADQIRWLYNQYTSLYEHRYLDKENYFRLKNDKTLENFITQSENVLNSIHSQLTSSKIADLEKIKNDIKTVEIIYYIFHEAFINKAEALRITYQYVAKINKKESIQQELIQLEKAKSELEKLIPKLSEIEAKRVENILYNKNEFNDKDSIKKLAAIITIIQSNSDIADFLKAADTAINFIHKEKKEILDVLERIKKLHHL